MSSQQQGFPQFDPSSVNSTSNRKLSSVSNISNNSGVMEYSNQVNQQNSIPSQPIQQQLSPQFMPNSPQQLSPQNSISAYPQQQQQSQQQQSQQQQSQQQQSQQQQPQPQPLPQQQSQYNVGSQIYSQQSVPNIQTQHQQQPIMGSGIPKIGTFSAPRLSNNGSLSPSGVDKPTGADAQFRALERKAQSFLDTLTPYYMERWVGTIIGLVLFLCRVLIVQGWYIICYTLCIYLLNLFLLFLTPMFDPALEENEEGDDGLSLPMRTGDEFRPFIRRLPEFKFWISATRAILIALFCSYFSVFDIPVFWPILLMYFFVLFGITMRRQIAHMIKYKYVPWTAGKKRYQGRG